MTRQLARRITALCAVLTALAAAACGTLPSSSGGGRTQHVDRTPIGQAHYWGAMSEDPDAPPSQV
jgi:hypothetical protein